MHRQILLSLFLVSSLTFIASAESPASKLVKHSDEWFRSDEGRKTLANLLTWQADQGGWPKNEDTTSSPYTGDRNRLQGTFDNGATTGELRALARAYRVTGEATYEQAFNHGLEHILQAQYPNGGWPQYFPLSKSYHRHITFNDDCMIRLMQLLQDIATREEFAYLSPSQRTAAAKAVQRGVDCILKCQTVVAGSPTVWCAQHDEVTLLPAKGRAFELPSLSGAESAGILRFLMKLDNPSPEVIQAVKHGVAWFEASKIKGIKYRRSETEPNVVADPKGGPLWARCYELSSNRPLFCGRDGVAKYNLDEIDAERQGGYTWYGDWGNNVLTAYDKWPYRER